MCVVIDAGAKSLPTTPHISMEVTVTLTMLSRHCAAQSKKRLTEGLSASDPVVVLITAPVMLKKPVFKSSITQKFHSRKGPYHF